jgi:hypothetical protein
MNHGICICTGWQSAALNGRKLAHVRNDTHISRCRIRIKVSHHNTCIAFASAATEDIHSPSPAVLKETTPLPFPSQPQYRPPPPTHPPRSHPNDPTPHSPSSHLPQPGPPHPPAQFPVLQSPLPLPAPNPRQRAPHHNPYSFSSFPASGGGTSCRLRARRSSRGRWRGCRRGRRSGRWGAGLAGPLSRWRGSRL